MMMSDYGLDQIKGGSASNGDYRVKPIATPDIMLGQEPGELGNLMERLHDIDNRMAGLAAAATHAADRMLGGEPEMDDQGAKAVPVRVGGGIGTLHSQIDNLLARVNVLDHQLSRIARL